MELKYLLRLVVVVLLVCAALWGLMQMRQNTAGRFRESQNSIVDVK